jgi:hypothetical protein
MAAAGVFLNAFAYSLVVAIPLPQSDAWRFLDTFLGDFIDHGFSWRQLFSQTLSSDTNLPLYKLFLFFHTRYFGMDFRLEGVLGIVCAALMLAMLVRVAAGPVREWRGMEAALALAVAMATFSLNSTNIYTWPLATQWYLTLLVAVIYMWVARTAFHRPIASFLAAFLLGVLLDEVAYPVAIAALSAEVLAAQWRDPRPFLRHALPILGGVTLSRVFYAICAHLIVGATGWPDRLGPSWTPLLSPEIWKAAIYPLADSVVHVGNVPLLTGQPMPWLQPLLGIVLLAMHGWFWWRVTRRLRAGRDVPAGMAATLMLFCYALILGVVVQRVSTFGFDYLHQPRYVMYYQLHLVALAIVAYRELRDLAVGTAMRSALAAAAVVLLLAFAGLQFRLGTFAWEHAKYLSKYVEGAALSLGKLAADPDQTLQCADILTVCDFPVEQRRRIMGRLVQHRLNLFSPEFQAFHRLYPALPCPAVTPTPSGPEAP